MRVYSTDKDHTWGIWHRHVEKDYMTSENIFVAFSFALKGVKALKEAELDAGMRIT